MRSWLYFEKSRLEWRNVYIYTAKKIRNEINMLVDQNCRMEKEKGQTGV